MNKAVQIVTLAVGLALSPAGFVAAHFYRTARPRQAFGKRDPLVSLGSQTKKFDIPPPRRRHRATAPRRPPNNNADSSDHCPTPNYEELARNGHPIVPDFT